MLQSTTLRVNCYYIHPPCAKVMWGADVGWPRAEAGRKEVGGGRDSIINRNARVGRTRRCNVRLRLKREWHACVGYGYSGEK